MRALLVLLSCLAASGASAQRLVAHDTLSRDTPSVVSCGFCGDEVIGVVFRELGGIGGLRPSDFPLRLSGVQVALAAAATDGTSCTASALGGVVSAEVEVWAGASPPSALPAADVTFGMAWPGETLVFASEAVPIELSTPTMDGSTLFNLQFNAFEPRDDANEPIVVAEGNTYLRVAVRLPRSGANNPICAAPLETPSGFPLRDDDGRIAPERSFLYAGGVGWLWNETARVNGDWAIRVEVAPMPVARDAGTADAETADAAGLDAGTADAAGLDAASVDAGPLAPGGGCGCRAGRGASGAGGLALLGLALVWRRRR
jgi:MYXO-CTERM domain-containing protein